MAIVLEEEKRPTNWVAILSVVIIVVVLFVGSYFLFFKKPELIEIVVPKSLQDIGTLSKLSFDPSSVINSPVLKLLRQYGTNISQVTPGRSNPFRPF